MKWYKNLNYLRLIMKIYHKYVNKICEIFPETVSMINNSYPPLFYFATPHIFHKGQSMRIWLYQS